MEYTAHSTAVIDEPALIGEGTRIWHFSHICSDASIGRFCTLGQNVMIGSGVVIGNHVKIQNNVSVYTGTTIEDEVFLGPSCVLTNVSNPRAEISRCELFETTHIGRGATVGANATIICGITIGKYAFIGAGAVVSGNVPDYALMLGVLARRVGWMSRHGQRLRPEGSSDAAVFICPESGYHYRETEPEKLCCLDLPEAEELPKEFR